MKVRFNLWSFILSFLCIVLLIDAISPSKYFIYITNFLQIHPLKIVLGISSITFLSGIVGLLGINNRKSLIRGILTIIITLGISLLAFLMIFMANIFQFT